MNINQTAKSTIYLDGKQAEAELKTLEAAVDKYTKKMSEARKANDKAGFDKAKKEYLAANKEMKSYKKTVVDVTKVLNNLNGTAYNKLIATQRKLERETRGMNKTTKEEIALYNKKIGQLKLVKAQTTKVRMEMNNASMATKGWMSKMTNGFNKYSMLIMSLAASLTGIIFSFRKAIDASNDYGESLANLSALTGLAGEELDYLDERAMNFAGSTTEAGIRITKSSQDIIDAYTQMGSKRPELLKNKEALADVTEQAIILSQAAKMKLVPATNSLAISMNQFNAGASEAPRYINAIAAGSKEGAGDVLYLATALEKAGTSADKIGLSIEETIAVIETIAPKFSEPARAGTQLRNIFLKLQTGVDEFNPSIVGMEKALNNLGDAHLGTKEMVELFNVENVDAARILIDNRDEYVRYRDAVTDTNVATEQAIKNTSTNKAKLEAARATLQKLTIELGSKLAPALTFSTSGFGKLIKGTMAAIKFFKEYGDLIVANATIIGIYTIAVNATTIAQKAWNFAVSVGDKVMKLFNSTVNKNPLMALAAVFTSVIVSILYFIQKTDTATESQKKLNDEIERGKSILNDNKSLEKRAEIISQMSEKQLEQFKSDAEVQLKSVSQFDEQKLLAQQKYLKEVEKLKQMKEDGARYIDIIYQREEVTRAADHFSKMQAMTSDANAEQLQDYIDYADERLNILSGGDTPTTTLEQFIEKNKTEFEEWKKARDIYLADQAYYDYEKKKEYDDMMKEYDSAMSEDFDFEEENIEEDPEIARELRNAAYMLELWSQTYEGRVELLDQALAKGDISALEHADRIKAIDNEITAGKIANAQQYFQMAGKLAGALTMMYTVQMNKELAAAGNNEAKKETIKLKYAKKQQEMAVVQARINGALSIMSMWATAPNPIIGAIYTAIAIAMTEIEVAAIKSQQFAEGNYLDVIGADDNKKYRAKVGNNQSRLVTQPTFEPGLGLVAENDPELVFSPADTQAIMNTPELINAINNTIGVNQYAQGNAQQIIPEQSPDTPQTQSTNNDSNLLLAHAINRLITEGVIAKLHGNEDYINTHNEVMNEYNDFIKRAEG